MRIAVLTETFAVRMGYAGSMLPKFLARLGPEVHVVTTGLPPYHSMAGFEGIYGPRGSDDALVPGTAVDFEGYRIHVLGHGRMLGYVRMVGLDRALGTIRPDVVQTFAAIGPIPMDAALVKIRRGYKLFTGSHTTASVFPLAKAGLPAYHPQRIGCLAMRTLPGRFISLFSERCYAATVDCGEVAVRFFGVPRSKMAVCPLGVDTDIFHPRDGKGGMERHGIREGLGFSDRDIVCIYTGRFTDDKNPAILAEAVDLLAGEGRPFRGLFLGAGPQEARLRSHRNSRVLPFRPVQELGGFYRASDIGVWPTQESTSMLDAAACGLPTVVNHTLQAVERVEGNGLKYRLNDLGDLARALRLLEAPSLRSQLGAAGAEKMRRDFSWDSIARARLADYRRALGGRG